MRNKNGCDVSRVQLQGVFNNTVLASSAVVEQLNSAVGLNATAFMPRGAESTTTSTMDTGKQFAFLAKVSLLVIGGDIPRWGDKALVEKLRAAFQHGVNMGTSHGQIKHQAIRMSVHKMRIDCFISVVIEDLSTVVTTTLSATSYWHEPLGTNFQEGCSLPWRRLAPVLTLVGLRTSISTRSRSHLSK